METNSTTQHDLSARRKPLVGIVTLLVGAVLFGAFVLGLVAGAGTIWSKVASPAAAQPASATGSYMPNTTPGRGMRAGGYPSSTPTTSASTDPPSSPAGNAVAGVQPIRLVVDPPPLGGVYGSDGKAHDAFVPATFTMVAGETYKVTVINYDAMPHTWTSSALGVNATIPAGSATAPSKTTFTIHPTKAGTFKWYCATPCDSWSMVHNGYMRGTVTVEAG